MDTAFSFVSYIKVKVEALFFLFSGLLKAEDSYFPNKGMIQPLELQYCFIFIHDRNVIMI